MAIIKTKWTPPPHQKKKTKNQKNKVEKKEPLCTVGGNVSWHRHSRKQYESSWKTNRTTIGFSYTTSGIYTKELRSGSPTDTHTLLFSISLLTMARK
jgi:hypothetical protein